MTARAVPPRAQSAATSGEELYRRLQLSLLLRVIMITFLLGATIIIHLSRTESFLTIPLIALYFLSGLTYFVTLLSLLLLRFLKRLTFFAFTQIIWELFFVSALIYVTGGVESPFSFLYLLSIIMGGSLLYRRGTFFAAVFGSLFFGLVIAGMEKSWLPPLVKQLYHPVGWAEIIYNFFINLAAMFGMAVFSSYLTEKLRATGDELKETQRDREVLEALNDNIVRSISSGLITLDLHNRVMALNKAAQEMVGLSEEECRGKELKQIFPPANLILEEGTRASVEMTSRHEVICWENPEEKRTYLEFRVAPLLSAENERLGTLVILNDITELREMEERLKKSDRLAAIGQLAAGMAHEIRNPLASISGSVQILAQEQKVGDETSQRLMRIILRETERLNRLIKDFLVYARPEPRQVQSVDLGHLVGELHEVYQQRHPRPPPVEWDLQIAPGLVMETDPRLLEQVFWNLINNALEAMPEGGRLTLRGLSHLNPAGETWVRLEVEDTGKGIPPHLRDKIFDPFFTTRETGTGLGLSIVYRIVEAMGGGIAVEDVKTGGTRFVLHLPLAYSLEEKLEEKPAAGSAKMVEGSR